MRLISINALITPQIYNTQRVPWYNKTVTNLKCRNRYYEQRNCEAFLRKIFAMRESLLKQDIIYRMNYFVRFVMNIEIP